MLFGIAGASDAETPVRLYLAHEIPGVPVIRQTAAVAPRKISAERQYVFDPFFAKRGKLGKDRRPVCPDAAQMRDGSHAELFDLRRYLGGKARGASAGSVGDAHVIGMKRGDPGCRRHNARKTVGRFGRKHLEGKGRPVPFDYVDNFHLFQVVLSVESADGTEAFVSFACAGARLVYVYPSRRSHDGADLPRPRDISARRQLYRHVAHCRRLDGTGKHAPSGKKRRRAAEQSVLYSSADHPHGVEAPAEQLFKCVGGISVFVRETFVNASRRFAGSRRDRLPGAPAVFRDPSGNIPGRRKDGVVGIDEGNA